MTDLPEFGNMRLDERRAFAYLAFLYPDFF